MPNIEAAQNPMVFSNPVMNRDKHSLENSANDENLAHRYSTSQEFDEGGIHLAQDSQGRLRLQAMLNKHRLFTYVTSRQLSENCCVFRLKEQYANQYQPKANTLDFEKTLPHDLRLQMRNIECEIIFTMLGAPLPLIFPNFDEFAASVRVRSRIVSSARCTQLAFETSKAERPEDCWVYKGYAGYALVPGQSLITALEKATQPNLPDGPLYSFSCYRATEYVILHGITQELAHSNPNLLRQIQHLWEVRPIKSGEYHDVFLDEYGSTDTPIPIKFYIPGDRVWFRNPDPHSSNASGYEGSWVIYLGNGLFSNFWKFGQPYTFTDKCIEIYHWRHATYTDDEGELRIDETIVDECVRKTKSDPNLTADIVQMMARPRDSKNVFAGGGCADITREFPKAICIGTAKIKIPNKNETVN